MLGRRTRGTPAPRSIEMTELRRKLGLARATISKAVKRLTQLGLVTCGLRPGGSQRNKVVFLTDEGAARIKRALHRVFTGRALARHYRRYVAKSYFKKPRNFAWLIAQELDRLWYELQDIARHHFDRSEVLYSIRSKPDH